MTGALKRMLPEPVKRPLRRIKHRVQNAAIEQFFHKTMTAEHITQILRRNRHWYIATYADREIISRHNADFARDPEFLKAYAFAKSLSGQERPFWSAYLLLWAARQASHVEGDFVECGTARGFAAASIIASIDLASARKRFLLFDSWAGLLNEQLTPGEQELYRGRLDEFNGEYSGYYEEVRRMFAPYPSVRLIKGYVPESLSQAEIPSVAFLHIDMNSVYPEVEALRHFWPKLSRGAWVVLDDYGQPGREEQKRGMDALARELRADIFSSPTGQGMLVKA